MVRSPLSPTDQRSIGQRLEALRLALDQSHQAEFARFVGIAPTTWNNYEKGYRRIRLEEAMKVRAKTGVTLDWIYYGADDHLPAHLARKLERMDKAG